MRSNTSSSVLPPALSPYKYHTLTSISPLSSPYFRLFHNYHHTSGPVSRVLILIPQVSQGPSQSLHPSILLIHQSLHTLNILQLTVYRWNLPYLPLQVNGATLLFSSHLPVLILWRAGLFLLTFICLLPTKMNAQ